MTAIKRITLATIIALAVALALATVNPASALAHTAGPAVPIESQSKGTLTFNKNGTVTGEESGHSNQLGDFTIQLKGTGTLHRTTIKAQGTYTVFTTAGDQLTGRFTTTGDLGKQRSVVKITGGTGRFAHARGTVIVDCITLGTPQETDDTLTIERQCTGRGELHL